MRLATLAAAVLLAPLLAAAPPARRAAAPRPAPPPRNIILIIGDGLGPPHVTLMRLTRGEKFQLGRMRLAALVGTVAADRTITDSAAAASALSTGVKTNYEDVAIDPSGVPRRTVLEVAESSGKATGLVTTAAFWDATPAAFAAHATHRDESISIIRQMLRSGTDIIAGNGAQRFGKGNFPTLEELARESGYTLLRTRAEVDAATSPPFLAVFPAVRAEMDAAEVPLSHLTRWALSHLVRDPDGFFLMVEHEGIDSSSHLNDRDSLAAALASFDEAIGVVLDFASPRNDTLVLLTSDHETGGMRVTETPTRRRPRVEFSTIEHTGVDVPLFVFGSGAEGLTGFIDNTAIGKRLLELVGGRP